MIVLPIEINSEALFELFVLTSMSVLSRDGGTC